MRRPARGAALLVVIVALAVVTALAATLAYDVRVSLQIAANGRDELRAEYLAKGALNLSRLVLSFQDRLNRMGGGAPQGGGTSRSGRGAAQAPPPAPAFPVPQLWTIVPVNSGLLSMIFAGGAADPDAAEAPPEGAAPAARSFGDFDGAFEARIENEGAKVNLHLDAVTAGLRAAQYLAFTNLIEDRRWDFLFDREDEKGNRVARQDLPIYLHDWVDEDNVTSVLTGNPANPFEDGSSDENAPYDRGQDRYKAKNAHFDSLDEVFLVAGVSDAFMAAFGDQVTVYLPKDEPMALPCADARALARFATLLASPPGQPILADPEFATRLQESVRDLTSGCLLALTPQQFGAILTQLGVAVNQAALSSTAASPLFTSKATVFRVRAAGSVGAVTRRIDAVVSFSPKHAVAGGRSTGAGDQIAARQAQALEAAGLAGGGQAAGTLGRIIHWKEE